MNLNLTVMCWCDETGIAKPMQTEEAGGFRCELCGNHVSATLFKNDGSPIPMENTLSNVQQALVGEE